MPSLDSPQFKDYAFRVKKTSHGTEASVAKRTNRPGHTFLKNGVPTTSVSEEVVPLGSMSIYTNRFVNQREQEEINDPHYNMRHGTDYLSASDQIRWTGGNMEPDNPHVGWAGMLKHPGQSRLLSGVAAIAVHEHGSMPQADTALSDTGARLARGAARKYGMKPGESNPEMAAGFDSLSQGSIAYEAKSSWAQAAPTQGGKEYSAAQASAIVRDMDDQYRLRPEKPGKTHIHTGQQTML